MCRRFVGLGTCVLSGRLLLLGPDYCFYASLNLGKRALLYLR